MACYVHRGMKRAQITFIARMSVPHCASVLAFRRTLSYMHTTSTALLGLMRLTSAPISCCWHFDYLRGSLIPSAPHVQYREVSCGTQPAKAASGGGGTPVLPDYETAKKRKDFNWGQYFSGGGYL